MKISFLILAIAVAMYACGAPEPPEIQDGSIGGTYTVDFERKCLSGFENQKTSTYKERITVLKDGDLKVKLPDDNCRSNAFPLYKTGENTYTPAPDFLYYEKCSNLVALYIYSGKVEFTGPDIQINIVDGDPDVTCTLRGKGRKN
jgi:hypothetical protein